MFKKLFFLSLMFNTMIAAEKDSKPLPSLEYDHVISLGDYCQVAWQLSLHNKRQEAYPFDWVLIAFEGVYQFIANEGKNFLDPDKLIYVDNIPAYIGGRTFYIEDTVYRMQLLHDFECSRNFLDNYDHIKRKYDRRINRFFSALHLEKNILFVRRGITYEQAVLLDDLIHNQYPQLSYTILAIDGTEEIKQDWGLERVVNFYVSETDPWNWVGDKNAWFNILDRFAVKVIPNPDPLDDYENR